MKAIALHQHLPISNPQSLQDMDLPMPVAQGCDLLVKIEAISVNPIDVKVRAAQAEDEVLPKVLGWDAAGVVQAVGPDVSLFKVGDTVYYAGSVVRQGANSEFHLVDERIVGHKPKTLNFAQAAALPLTTITAWESLFQRLEIAQNAGQAGPQKSLLIIGGAGGVGSIAIQLAKKLTNLRVIATASRPDSVAWVQRLGADHVINHFADMPAQLKAIGIDAVDYIFCTADTATHFAAMSAMIAAQGKIALIVPTEKALPIGELTFRSVSLHWEMMFTRSMFATEDMIEQHHLLNRAADLIDQGEIQTTLTEVFGKINASNLRRAHEAIEAGHTIGKIVLAGF